MTVSLINLLLLKPVFPGFTETTTQGGNEEMWKQVKQYLFAWACRKMSCRYSLFKKRKKKIQMKYAIINSLTKLYFFGRHFVTLLSLFRYPSKVSIPNIVVQQIDFIELGNSSLRLGDFVYKSLKLTPILKYYYVFKHQKFCREIHAWGDSGKEHKRHLVSVIGDWTGQYGLHPECITSFFPHFIIQPHSKWSNLIVSSEFYVQHSRKNMCTPFLSFFLFANV